MALETSNDAPEAWVLIKRAGRQLAINLPARIADLQNGSVKLEFITFDIYQRIRDTQAQINLEKNTIGLNAYVVTVKPNNPTYDAVDEVNTVSGLIQDALDWMDTNASGLSLTGDTLSNAIANGSVVTNRFTPAQTSDLRTMLSAVLAEINII